MRKGTIYFKDFLFVMCSELYVPCNVLSCNLLYVCGYTLIQVYSMLPAKFVESTLDIFMIKTDFSSHTVCHLPQMVPFLIAGHIYLVPSYCGEGVNIEVLLIV